MGVPRNMILMATPLLLKLVQYMVKFLFTYLQRVLCKGLYKNALLDNPTADSPPEDSALSFRTSQGCVG